MDRPRIDSDAVTNPDLLGLADLKFGWQTMNAACLSSLLGSQMSSESRNAI